jgi:hypothetical protein
MREGERHLQPFSHLAEMLAELRMSAGAESIEASE